MTCHDVREQLSALLDDALLGSPSARRSRPIWPRAPNAAGSSRSSARRWRSRPPSAGHAPAGFVDRVMAQASRPPWRRRLLDALFVPLRVKLPLEAAAVLLVGVSALYVYQRTPEVQQLARQEARASPRRPWLRPASWTGPRLPPDAGRDREARPRTPRASAGRAPSRGAARRRRRRHRRRAGGRQGPPAPALHASAAEPRPAAPAPDAEPTAGAPGEEGGAGRAAAGCPRREPSSSAGTEGSTQSAEPRRHATRRGSRRPRRPRRRRAPPAVGVAAQPRGAGPCGRRRVRAVGRRPRPRARRRRASSAAKSRFVARLMRAVDASGRLAVSGARARRGAPSTPCWRELGATRVARRLEGERGMVVIDVLVPGARYRELIEGLGQIGRWVTEHEPRALPAQVRVEVALTVEP